MIKNYFITALRTIWRNKFFSLINIVGLSVGVACCMLIFLYGKDEVSFDRFNVKKDNIYRITADLVNPSGKTERLGSTGMMPGPAFKRNIPEIGEFVRLQSNFFNVKTSGGVFEQEALWSDENLFSVFTIPMVQGNPATALKDLHSVVLSEEVAKKYFGTADALNKTLSINTGEVFEPFTVTGVVKNPPQNSSLKISMLLPMKLNQLKENDTHWMNFFLNTFVVLKPGSNLKSVEAKFAQVHATEAAAEIKEMAEKFDNKNKTVYHLQPLLQMHLSTDYPADNGLSSASNPVYSYILTGIAIFVLLIACINFINLTVARSLKRAKEIGIRKVIGSERKQLILQFLGESFILSFFAFVFAGLLAYCSLPFFNTLANKELSFSYLLDTKLIAGYIILFIATGLLAGFYPALVLSGFKPVDTLYGKLRFSSKNYLSKSLVVFQFTLSTFLIIATITIYSQFNYLTKFNLGYDDKNVMVLRTPLLNNATLDVFKNELYKSSFIKQVTADQGGSRNTMAHVNGEQEINFNFVHIDEDYLPLFKISVIHGRNFSRLLSSDTVKSVLVNEAFVKAAGWKKPVGEVVDFFYNNKKFNVIGVVKNHHFEALTSQIRPQLYTFLPRYEYRVAYIKIEPGHKVAALRFVEKTFKRLYPDQPYQYKFEDDNNKEQYTSEAKWKQIIAFASLLTIFISCMGLFGLALLSAEKRAKEISIRKVLGASVLSIMQKLSGDFIRLVSIAACIALPAAWWAMHTWLDNYPYHIELSLFGFCMAVGFVVLIALLTTGYQAMKAAVANPVKSLRAD